MKLLKKIFMGSLLCFFSLSLQAGYSTTNVPVDDPVYRDIDKLVTAGLVKDVIYGQRPWSRREIARIISVSLKKFEEIRNPTTADDGELSFVISLEEILERLKKEYKEDLTDQNFQFHPLEQARFDYTFLKSPSRVVPVTNGLGNIDAFVNPLVSYQEGRHYSDGNTLGLETTHRATLGPYISFYARPRFEMLVPRSGANEVNPIVQQLYGKFAYKNFEVEAGRDSLIWGQGEFGGLLLSNNARPLDMIKISTSAPFYHPWILKYLGPSKYTFFVANLGPEREYPYSFIYGVRASAKPTSFLELGFNHTLIIGGKAGPSIQWTDPLSEFFFYRRGGARGEGSNVTDHRFGIDWRLKIPPLRNAEWYFETIWDDFGRETVIANITEQMGFVSGLYFPFVTFNGTTDFRIEYIHIPPILYRHGIWISGYMLNQHILGSESGPDSDTIRLVLRHDLSSKYQISFEGNYFHLDSDLYIQTVSSKEAPDRIIKITDNPIEHRLLLKGDLHWKINPSLEVKMGMGYERIKNFNFVPGSNDNNFLLSLSLRMLPGF